MALYVALRSSHHVLQEAKVFQDEAAALAYANAIVEKDGFTPKDSGDKPWLGNWGDEDGCGVIVAPADIE